MPEGTDSLRQPRWHYWLPDVLLGRRAQVEQDLAYARLLAGLHGVRARREVAELVGFLVEVGAGLPLSEDKLTTIMEAAQVRDGVCSHWCTLVLRP